MPDQDPPERAAMDAEVASTAKWYHGFVREVLFVLALPALAAVCMIVGYYFFGG